MKKTLLDKAESLLKNESAYCTEDGTLLKNKIAQDASQFSPSLLKLLLSDEDTKKAFFAESDGIIIFNSAKFAQFLSSKNFLPDSYTSYKNKIGLNATNITGGVFNICKSRCRA